ncbi:hypothetical protein [Mycolicibacterium sphagni]|uniref:Uncharacterized protein n=1 Tax=Mycolicibacterium sphagni TaxID=1786 RepID=A0A255DI10_9MYCO|nr:hypothetical protein [Mycolicibacterium sphagni]OYN78904.1 hypothetical protein CG716_13630 [Mycolicibacterium sphagni]
MATRELDESTATLLQSAIGPIEHLRLTHAEYTELLYTLAWFVGGSFETVAFVAEQPEASTGEHRVYWLRGKTFGCLIIGAHQGPEGDKNAKLLVSGYVRPISDIRNIELQDVQIDWPRWGTTRVPELLPTVQVHFNDMTLTVDATSRTNEFARSQATAFIERLQSALAGSG